MSLFLGDTQSVLKYPKVFGLTMKCFSVLHNSKLNALFFQYIKKVSKLTLIPQH